MRFAVDDVKRSGAPNLIVGHCTVESGGKHRLPISVTFSGWRRLFLIRKVDHGLIFHLLTLTFVINIQEQNKRYVPHFMLTLSFVLQLRIGNEKSEEHDVFNC